MEKHSDIVLDLLKKRDKEGTAVKAVVTSYTDQDGTVVDTLECGHTISTPNGSMTIKAKRCTECSEGKIE
jgi:hypothetical protein